MRSHLCRLKRVVCSLEYHGRIFDIVLFREAIVNHRIWIVSLGRLL
ncbi:MAG TPA: hypothetical protein VK775_06065 [Chthoniobacterales bacterium]|nr:hypothetical protein [Chthoniobacterales bacterium]